MHFRPIETVLLRRAAQRYAAHGWDVMPGAAFNGERHRCDDPGCPTFGCHPALEGWTDAASRDSSLVVTWWHRNPYTVLLPTGREFDVLELPTRLGVVVARGPIPAPVAVTGTGSYLIFVSPGDPLRPELARSVDVVLHGRHSWVAAPPSRDLAGRVRWEVSPEEVGWQLPDSYAVQRLLVDLQAAMAPTRPTRLQVQRLIEQVHRAA